MNMLAQIAAWPLIMAVKSFKAELIYLPVYLLHAHTHKPGHNEVQYMYNLSQTYRYAFIHCILPPLCADKRNGEQKAVFDQRALIKVLRLLYPRPDLFVFPFFLFLFFFHPPLLKTETAVNYWLTWVLITMQIWGKMKSKAAGSCHIPPSPPRKKAWLEGRLLWTRFMLSNSGEMKREEM